MFAIFGYLAINLISVLTLFPPFRWFLKSMVPQGTGPSEELQRTGYMNMHILGDGKSNGSRVAVKGLVAAHGADPGYTLTGQMLCESALCLVFDARYELHSSQHRSSCSCLTVLCNFQQAACSLRRVDPRFGHGRHAHPALEGQSRNEVRGVRGVNPASKDFVVVAARLLAPILYM